MSEISKQVKRREVKKKGVFSINSIYKTLKEEIKNRKYDYTEKERTLKQTRKGDLYRIVMVAERKFDYFVKFNFQIDITAENVKHGKVDDKMVDMGDFKAVFSSNLELDYLNKWNRSAIGKFLFHIYINYLIKHKIESYYEAKCMEDVNYYHDLLKELLENG